jgi:dihydroneopterin aldolase
MQDKMILKGMRFYGFHGNLPAEKALGQWFQVDVELTIDDLSKAAATDALEHTLNYAALYAGIKIIVEGSSVNLLETLAGRIMDICFEFYKVTDARVRVEKPQAPLGGPLEYAAIELVRSRQEWQETRRHD